ncbi:hypothetical protein [Burkholderia cenocepacia]|uniref:hypothetical protein n=1 Tax=Burkholderia cenocepacia TaxID=95486 RepID=UPI000761F590|nr:hypothetical protein [Burkholderia cenocepacia]KWU19158.1 hypothetical protein AS149_12995 [Burkholderia cenocepacia]
MGYNATVVIRNDALKQIASDPKFGEKLAEAVTEAAATVHGTLEVAAGNHANAAQVVECHHADTTVVVAVGGNLGAVMTSNFGYRLNDPELQLALVRRWADKLGYRLEKLSD